MFGALDKRDTRREPEQRANHRIRVPEVRVIGADGKMIGVMKTHEAVAQAKAAGLDLVEVDPRAQPPVCRVCDFGKLKYDKKKEDARRRASQVVVETKEIKLRPKTGDHDIAHMVARARTFLGERHKVKFTVRFRGREITHPEKAREQLDLVLAQIADLAIVEQGASMEQRAMYLLVGPKPLRG
jgi:translation initiation factor IF-3